MRTIPRVKRALAGLAAVLTLAGCGGDNAGGGLPAEEPGAAMTRLIRYELAGKLEHSYAMLVTEQRKIVDRKLYVSCPPGPPLADVHIAVLGVRDELFHVPALGRTQTKAVTWRMFIGDAQGEPIAEASVGHLIAQDGQWRWTLSPRSFDQLRNRNCPH
jgi:hypothetical protein